MSAFGGTNNLFANNGSYGQVKLPAFPQPKPAAEKATTTTNNNNKASAKTTTNQLRIIPDEIADIVSSSNPGDKKIHFKATFEKHARRFAVPNQINYAELCRLIRFLFHIDSHLTIEMSYYDGSGGAGPLIVFDTDFELREMAHHATLNAIPKWAQPVCLHINIK